MSHHPRLRIVTGKGGVGKTVVATALALAEARNGRRVLLAETNAGDQVAALLGVRPTAGEMREALENIYLIDMRPQEAIREYALMVLRFETVYNAVFGNRLVRHFIKLVPSLGELTMLGKLWYHLQEKEDGALRFDRIILDAPSTGHAISMLRSPEGVAATVPPGMLRENCHLIRNMLRDKDLTVMHIVTTPEEMPVNEAVMLEQAASDVLDIRLGTTFINHHVDRLPPGTLETLSPLADDPTTAAAYRALSIRDAKVRAGDGHLARLPARMLDHSWRLPRLVGHTFGSADVERLADITARMPEFREAT